LHAEDVREKAADQRHAMPVNKYCMAIILWSVDQKVLLEESRFGVCV
jgi:hypothetical protein